MDDRIVEIREALRQWDAGELLQSDIARLAAAARAYVDGKPLDSDTLIIRRDGDGEWDQQMLRRLRDAFRSQGDDLSAVLDALASSLKVDL